MSSLSLSFVVLCFLEACFFVCSIQISYQTILGHCQREPIYALLCSSSSSSFRFQLPQLRIENLKVGYCALGLLTFLVVLSVSAAKEHSLKETPALGNLSSGSSLSKVLCFMGTMTTSTMPFPRVASNFDEVSMHQSLLFSDSLKDLKNLRSQLYSAAEYFELSYTNDDQKHTVVETLKDYAIKALVNTVDHLGSVTYKVNDLLDEKVDEVSGTEFRVSCIEQRLRTCQEYIDHEGLSQQSSVIDTPKYHKRYILPVGETMRAANKAKSKYQGCNLDDGDEWHQFRNAVRATIRETPTTVRGRSPSPSPQPSQRPAVFSFTSTMPKKELVKRTVSPHRFPLLRSGSLASRATTPSKSQSTTPNSSRPTTPNPSNARRRYPSEPRKSASMRLPAERDNGREVEQYPTKSKRLLKALLSRRKSKKDDMLYTYLDEY